MEIINQYGFVILGIIIVLVGIHILLQVRSIRDRANALFLEVEKNVNDAKLEYVAGNLYDFIPTIARVFISYDAFVKILQKTYDKTRELARDVLNDGKLNGK